MTCFICLGSTKNKVCFKCNCFAHAKCWHEYLSKSKNICPICKTNNIYTKYKTRSKHVFFLDSDKVKEITNIINNMDNPSILIKNMSDLIHNAGLTHSIKKQD
jgi:hypothetical protein